MIAPLLGREEVLREATAALDERRIICLYGPEGYGKTRLATELAATATKSAAKRAWIRGTPELREFPFAAVMHLTRADLDSQNPSVALRQATEDLSRTSAVVIVVDDYPLLDESSAAVIRSFAERPSTRLVLTARSELMPDSFRRLERDLGAFVARLEPLVEIDARALCTAVAGCRLSPAAESRLARLAGGVPLHLVQLTKALLEAGSLAVDGGILDLISPIPAAKLRELVGGQLAGLSPKDRRVLELIALAEPIDAEALLRLTDAETLSSLQDRQLIGERSEPRYESEERLFIAGHPLYSEALLADLPGIRRNLRLVELAEAVGKSKPVRAEHVARQILWLHSAGHDVSSADLAGGAMNISDARLKGFLAVAQGASEVRANERLDSARLLHDSIRDRYEEMATLAWLAHSAEPTVQNSILLLRSLISCDHALDQAAELIRTLAQTPGLSPDQDLEIRRYARIVHAYHFGDSETALAVVNKEPLPAGREKAVALERAAVSLYAGRLSDATRDLRVLTRDDHLTQFERATSALELAVGCIADGRPIETIDLVDEFFPTAMANGAEASFAASMWWLRSVAKAFDAKFDEAEDLLASTFNASLAADSIEGAGFFADGLATVARLQGRYRTAVRRSRLAVDLLAIRDVGQRTHAMGELAISLCVLGETEAARATFNEIIANPTHRVSGRSVLPLVRTYVAALEGKSIGNRDLDDVWDELDNAGAQSQLALLSIALLLGRSDWAADRGSSLRGLVQGRLNELQLDATDAVATGDPSVIREVHHHAVTLGAHGIGWVLANAGLLRASGRRDGSAKREWASLVAQAQHVAEGPRGWPQGVWPQGTRSQGVESSARQPIRLSRRESHIASLANDGMTDAAIASRLGLSVRTVESHLTRAYSKLSVSGRRELGSHFKTRTRDQ